MLLSLQDALEQLLISQVSWISSAGISTETILHWRLPLLISLYPVGHVMLLWEDGCLYFLGFLLRFLYRSRILRCSSIHWDCWERRYCLGRCRDRRMRTRLYGSSFWTRNRRCIRVLHFLWVLMVIRWWFCPIQTNSHRCFLKFWSIIWRQVDSFWGIVTWSYRRYIDSHECLYFCNSELAFGIFGESFDAKVEPAFGVDSMAGLDAIINAAESVLL